MIIIYTNLYTKHRAYGKPYYFQVDTKQCLIKGNVLYLIDTTKIVQ